MPDGPERTKLSSDGCRSWSRAYAPWMLDGVPLRERARPAVAARLQVQRRSSIRSRTSTSTSDGERRSDRRPSGAVTRSGACDRDGSRYAARRVRCGDRASRRSRRALALRRPQPQCADPAKTLRVAFPVAETGFDPQATSDLYSDHVQARDLRSAVRLRLSRPAVQARAPNTAAAMPEISADGRTWTIRDQARHLFRRRSGVQGQEARARRRRLRLFVEAAARSASALADLVVPARARSSAPTTVIDAGEAGGQARLRRADRGPAASTATRCGSS